MGKIFQNFWTINVGHVWTIAAIVFGGGVAWRSVAAQQDADRASAMARADAISATIAASVSERDLKIATVTDRVALISERISKDEDTLKALGSMDREIGTLNAQMKALNDEIASFRAELRDYQRVRIARAVP